MNNTTLVLLSGGMDSATALALVLRNSDSVEAISFDYGQRHGVRELQAARDLAAHFSVQHTVVDLKSASEVFAGSALTGEGEIPEGHYEDESMRKTVVPNRNMIMLSLAAGLAISKKIGRLIYAAHAGDHAIYPDCRPQFAGAVALAIKVGNYDAPELQFPFILRSKAEIASIGTDLGVPFEKTWSCYKGGEKHCGACGTCVERIEAFKLAGVSDPTEYETTLLSLSNSELEAPESKSSSATVES